MLPWGHAALGYLVYRALLRLDAPDRRPGDAATLVLGVGLQLPDLVDKPGAWTLGVLPAGRSVGHALPVVVPLLAVLWVVASPARRSLVVAFAVGVGSHLVGDSWAPALRGDFADLSFLLWPLLPVEPEHGLGFVEFFLSLTLTPTVAAGLVVTGVGLAVWNRDGRPGLALVWSWASDATGPSTDR